MEKAILGISAGTRTIGIGVLEGDNLNEWEVKTFKGVWSRRKMSLILETITGILQYSSVADLAIKIISPLSISRNVKHLTEAIITLAKKRGVKVYQLTIHDLKRNTGRNGKHSKNDLMEYMTEQFPILRKTYIKERNNLNPYYLPMFEAIAAAMIVQKEK